MKKKILFTFVIIMLCVCMHGCADTGDTILQTEPPADTAFSDSDTVQETIAPVTTAADTVETESESESEESDTDEIPEEPVDPEIIAAENEKYLKEGSAYRDAWVTILEMLAEEKYYSGSVCADASYNNYNHYYFLRDSNAIIEFANILNELQPIPKETAQYAPSVSLSHIYVDSFFLHR